MRIIHVISSIDIALGGTTFALKHILRIEKTIGYKSDVLTLKSGNPYERIKDFSIDIHSFPSDFSGYLNRSKTANDWLRKNICKYDLVIMHGVWGLIYLETAHIARRFKIPYVVRPHGSLDLFDLQKKRLAKKISGPLFIRKYIEGSAAIHITAKLEGDRLQTYGGRGRIAVLPIPFPPSREEGDRIRFRRKWGFGDEDFIILFLSRIDYKKGLNLIVPTLAKLKPGFPKLKLAICGSDSNGYERKVRRWVTEHGMESSVVFCGFLAGRDKCDAFSGSDCFVLPSLNENFGIAVIEALISGLPVIISDNVYIWKEIEEKNGGWICNYSIESLYGTMLQIVNRPEELEIKRNSAREAGSQFLDDRVLGLYAKEYGNLIKQGVNF